MLGCLILIENDNYYYYIRVLDNTTHDKILLVESLPAIGMSEQKPHAIRMLAVSPNARRGSCMGLASLGGRGGI